MFFLKKGVHITFELALILAICFGGDILAGALPFSFSASVLSMLVLLLLLAFRVIKLEQIQNLSSFFAANMTVLFIPYGVNLLQYLDVIRENLLPFLFIVLATTPIVYGVTALTAQLVMRSQVGEGE